MLKVTIDREIIYKLLLSIKKNIMSNGALVVSNRNKNNEFCYKYGMNSRMIKEIICNLKSRDFIKILSNEHIGYEDEYLFLFAPIIKLTNIYGKTNKVQIYLKLNYIKEKRVVIVVSIHKADYKLDYYFKERKIKYE